jgi:very-short-patch-repair endonuclease
MGIKVVTDGSKVQSDLQTARARELRQLAIDAEKKLWFHFQQGNTKGLKIRRQHPIGPYTLDFYCSKERLALEIDGSSHEFKQASDARRDGFMLSKGIETIRFGPGVADEGIIEFVEWFRDECDRRAAELGKP